MHRNSSNWWILALTLTACGGGTSSSETASNESTSGGETDNETEGFDMEGFEQADSPTVDHGSQSARELIGIHPPETPWEEMSDEEQEWYMIGTVLPIHSEIFAEYDHDRYAQFQCTHCHGDDGAERHYAMPSRYLPALPTPGSERWTAMEQGNPRLYQFMAETVTPTMATQLGVQPYDPATGEGFGCFGCHPHAQ